MRASILFCILLAALLTWARDSDRPDRWPRAGTAATSVGLIPSVAEVVEDEPPPIAEPMGRLELELLDEATGAPVDGTVALIRLGGRPAPPLLVSFHRRGRAQRLSIPVGKYQPVVLSEPEGTPDPDPIDVSYGAVTIRLGSKKPQTFRSWLRIRDECGRCIRAAEIWSCKGGESTGLPDRFAELVDSIYISAGQWHSDCVPEATADAQGRFDLGSWRESGRGWFAHSSIKLKVPGHGVVRVGDRNEPAGDHRFEAVVVSHAFLRNALRLPRNVEITVTSQAWLASHGESREDIVVRVRRSGYSELEYRISPDEVAKLPLRTLQPLVRSRAR